MKGNINCVYFAEWGIKDECTCPDVTRDHIAFFEVGRKCRPRISVGSGRGAHPIDCPHKKEFNRPDRLPSSPTLRGVTRVMTLLDAEDFYGDSASDCLFPHQKEAMKEVAHTAYQTITQNIYNDQLRLKDEEDVVSEREEETVLEFLDKATLEAMREYRERSFEPDIQVIKSFDSSTPERTLTVRVTIEAYDNNVE